MKNILALLVLFISTTVLSQVRLPVSNTLSDYMTMHTPLYTTVFSSIKDAPSLYRVVKFGYNLDIDATPNEDVWAVGGMISFPTLAASADTLTIVSSSASDDTISVGAQTVLITGVDSTGAEISETITLDGTTNVTSTLEYLFVNSAVVTSAGTSTNNVGNITISLTGSAATLSYIPATFAMDQQAMYRVPKGRNCYLNKLDLHTDFVSQSSIIFYVKVYDASRSVEYIVRRELVDNAEDMRMIFPDAIGLLLDENDVMTIEVDSNSGNVPVSATLDLICRDTF